MALEAITHHLANAAVNKCVEIQNSANFYRKSALRFLSEIVQVDLKHNDTYNDIAKLDGEMRNQQKV